MNVYLYTEDGVNYGYYLCYLYIFLHCHRTWKKGNFLKKVRGKKLKKHRRQGKVWNVFVLFVCFSGMHKFASSDQNFRGQCFA